LEMCGPAVTALDGTFARVWRRAGPPLPADELRASPPACGDAELRVVEGLPERSRIWRAVQLLAAAARERLWITDAYFVAPTPLFAALGDAARDGVDVRLMLPGSSDLPVLRSMTRIGYRELLDAGVRIFEWRGPMLHAKTLVVDREFVRIGSSNLNVASLVENYELDVLADDAAVAGALAEQFRRDMAGATEVVLAARRRLLPPRLVAAPASDAVAADAPAAHERSARERRRAAVVTLAQVAGGLRRRMAALTTGLTLIIGGLLLIFPRVMSITFAAGAFLAALGFGWYSVASRPGGDDVP
ncbi:MAG TPA: phospholipase D-like domain-containing protein, partial [Gemmatimonadales bacterium]|nr:phospholipase D-like domain-containing protein [Gemmatimonadales bacterium]